MSVRYRYFWGDICPQESNTTNLWICVSLGTPSHCAERLGFSPAAAVRGSSRDAKGPRAIQTEQIPPESSTLGSLFAQTALKCTEYAERPSTCKKSKHYWKHGVLSCFQRSTFVPELVTLPQKSFVLRLLWAELAWSLEELGTKQILQLEDMLRFSYGNEDSLTYLVFAYTQMNAHTQAHLHQPAEFAWPGELCRCSLRSESLSEHAVQLCTQLFIKNPNHNIVLCSPCSESHSWRLQTIPKTTSGNDSDWYLRIPSSLPLVLMLDLILLLWDPEVTKSCHKPISVCPARCWIFWCITPWDRSQMVLAFNLQHDIIWGLFLVSYSSELCLNIIRYLIFWHNHGYLWLLCHSTVTEKISNLRGAKHTGYCWGAECRISPNTLLAQFKVF